MGGILALPAARTCKAAVQNVFASSRRPKVTIPPNTNGSWRWTWTGASAAACAWRPARLRTVCRQNNFRTWIERYVITRPKAAPAKAAARLLWIRPTAGSADSNPVLDSRRRTSSNPFLSPNSAINARIRPARKSARSGATFESPDGVVLVDKNYCIGCGFCIQACPYGCRFFNPDDPHRRQMHAVLSPHHSRTAAGVRGDLPVAGAHFW